MRWEVEKDDEYYYEEIPLEVAFYTWFEVPDPLTLKFLTNR
jgi:hypothetical protein